MAEKIYGDMFVFLKVIDFMKWLMALKFTGASHK